MPEPAVGHTDLPYWVAFSRIPRVGRVRAALLERAFHSMEEAWKAGPADLGAAGLDAGTVAAIVAARPQIDPAAEIERLRKAGVAALTWHDPAYPARLKETPDPPPVLYVRGELTAQDEWAVAVVGTRRATVYGRQVAEEFARGLAASRVSVVSGLARGIDGIAHKAALEAGGRTLAVLACGLDLVYPPEHTRLAARIIEQGALISDYPLGTQPRSEYFPRRNRIMSGISLGVLVVEADIKSGALITARQALDQNREVFATPGSIFSPNSRGTNMLIRDGEARLVMRVEDILEELNLSMAEQQMAMTALLPSDETEALLLRQLSSEPIHIDEVRRGCGLPIATVSSALAMLELKGMVKQVGSMNYVRTREAPASYEV